MPILGNAEFVGSGIQGVKSRMQGVQSQIQGVNYGIQGMESKVKEQNLEFKVWNRSLSCESKRAVGKGAGLTG